LLHDNAPAHKAASVCQFLNPPKKLQQFITPPPYSPDLSRPDYFLFPKLKVKLQGLHFAGVAEIQEVITDELKKVQREEFSETLINCTSTQKFVYMPKDMILNNKDMSSSCVFDF
jgi:hypothetical protein